MKWEPIETAPAEPIDSGRDPQSIFVWVADDGINGKGAISFGYVYLSRNGSRIPRSNSHHGSWKITHWMPLPEPPK